MKTKDKLRIIGKTISVFSRIVLFISFFLLIAALIFFMIFLANAENAIKSEMKLYGIAISISSNEMLDLIIYFSVLILFLMKECFISNLYCRYFSVVKKAGTLFTKDAALELKKIGVATLILPLLFDIITAVLVLFSANGIFDNSILMNYNPFPSLARGAVLVYASSVSMCGAQTIRENKTAL